MSTNSIPKTFLIHASSPNGKKSGFLRYMSFQSKEGDISYKLVFVQKKTDGSKFLNFDNVKKLSYEYISKFKIKNVKIIDSNNGKIYNVKEAKRKDLEKENEEE